MTSTGKLIGRNGVFEVQLTDGHKLLLPMNSSRYVSINNADFLLTKKEKDEKK